MFNYCKGVTSLDLSSFDTSNVTTMSYMFSNATSVVTIYVSDSFVTDKALSSISVFTACNNLKNGDIKYSTSAKGIEMANTTTGYFTLKE